MKAIERRTPGEEKAFQEGFEACISFMKSHLRRAHPTLTGAIVQAMDCAKLMREVFPSPERKIKAVNEAKPGDTLTPDGDIWMRGVME